MHTDEMVLAYLADRQWYTTETSHVSGGEHHKARAVKTHK